MDRVDRLIKGTSRETYGRKISYLKFFVSRLFPKRLAGMIIAYRETLI